VLNLQDLEVGAFHEDDVRLMETMADQAGSALRSASLYERLERAYMGTAEALAPHSWPRTPPRPTTPARSSHTPRPWAVASGWTPSSCGTCASERLPRHRQDRRARADPQQARHVDGGGAGADRRHTVVGEQILAPVEFLAGARLLMRHEHERWDGRGYPDRLSGTSIPLGSRIILACDAFHAMTSDRPYRRAMCARQARGELHAHAGTQFDERVVEALLDVVGAGTAQASSLT
jgi:hypothetical protein